MSGTSIPSSPKKSDFTIYTTRLKRRSKRSKIDLSAQLNNSDEETNPDLFHNLLTDFYNDSEDKLTKSATLENKSKSLGKNPVILSNFKPFELEKSLAMADHIFVQHLSQNEANLFHETQGFVTCTNLSQANNKPQCYFINKDEKNQNDSFIITESELISCCHQAEKILENNNPIEEDGSLHKLTPKKDDDMILVNSILEDFSQSPLSKEQIITNVSWQYTPEFRLRRLPHKNYSRKHIKCTRINLTQRFKETDSINSPEYDEDISCSSLSVQEDDTFCENPNNQLTATPLNNTERLCENLLNLTEYFTQNEFSQSFCTDNFHSSKTCDIVSNLHKISDLLDNILALRSKYNNKLVDDAYDSSDDFNGFSDSEYKIDNDFVKRNAMIANTNFAPDVCEIRHYNNTKEKEDNATIDDWNEDNCHDIVSCTDTENVLQQRNIAAVEDLSSKYTNNDQTFIIPNAPNLNPALSNFIGLKTASSNPIQVSKEANIMAANLLTNFSYMRDFTEKDRLPDCDNKTLDKDNNIFENPEDYEWNDDCDLFLNFQTPISFKENIVTNTEQKIPALPEISQHEKDIPSTSKLATLGFATAAGKSVRITSKGQAAIYKLLNEFNGEINDNKDSEEELKEIKLKVYAKTHNLKTEPSSSSVKKQLKQNLQEVKASHAEKYSACPDILELKQETKSSEVSTKTQDIMMKMLEESADIPSENYLTDIETIENVFNRKDQRNSIDFVNSLFGEHSMKTDHLNIGLQTARGKHVSISGKAKQIVENFLKEFNTDVDIENDLKDIKTKVQIKNKNLKLKIDHSTHNGEDLQKNQLNTNISKGFQTAKGKEILISAEAKQTVESLLKEFNTDPDIENCEKVLKDLKARVFNKNKEIRPKNSSLDFHEDIVKQILNEKNDLNKNNNQPDESSAKLLPCENQSIKVDNSNVNTNIGFQTANGIQVSVSMKAKQAIENLLKDFNTDMDVETSEMYLKDIKTKMRNKNKDLQAKSISQAHEEATSTQNVTDNLSLNITNSKRKISIDNSDLETFNKTPATKIFKNDLQSSKSSLAEQSLKSPLTSATRSIIVRKNLLSLTKKRKNRANRVNKPTEEISETNNGLNDLNACTSTPAKSYVSIKAKEPAPETPNIIEFLSNASLTSTPRINKQQCALQSFEDSDLKPIIWKNDSSFCNKSENTLDAAKLSESSASNISFNSPNPTAKERIGRLKMYGKAPDVSPILIETNQNCRPSGLRRTRSMLKNLEN